MDLIFKGNIKTWLWIAAGTLGLLYVFWLDPAQSASYYPRCPLYSFTGIKCAGCGAQRALHQVLHLNFAEAYALNPLFVAAIPYILGGFAFDWLKPTGKSFLALRRILYGKVAIYLVFLTVICFTIFRNLSF